MWFTVQEENTGSWKSVIDYIDDEIKKDLISTIMAYVTLQRTPEKKWLEKKEGFNTSCIRRVLN